MRNAVALCVLLLVFSGAVLAGPETPAARKAAARFLSTLDPDLAGRGGRAAVEAHARTAGLRLKSLGPGWYEAFLQGRYRNPAPAPAAAVDGVHVGEDRDWVWFALPLGPVRGATPAVWRDGVAVPPVDVRWEPAPDGRATLVYLRNGGDFHWGARITVVGPDGRAHCARRPPDDVTLTCETTVTRGRERTRIRARPRVKTAEPEDRGRRAGPSRTERSGPRPAVRVKDDTGFFETLFRTLGKGAFSLAVGTAAGLVLTAVTAGRSRNVRVNPAVGSVELDVPTKAYDEARLQAAANGTPVTAEGVARRMAAVVVCEARSAPRSSRPKGLRVVRAWTAGGSLLALRPGQSVAFSLRGWAAPPTLASTSVALFEDGAPAGFLALCSVGEPDPAGCCTVIARIPPFTSTLSGDLQAEVRCPGQRSNRVILGLSPGRVEVTVLQPVVRPGSRASVVLRNPAGGPVRGTLRLAGPGRFSSTGGSACTVDSDGPQAVVHVVAAAPGRIDVRFESKR